MVELVEDALLGSRPRSKSPLAGVVSEQRRVALVSVPLAELKAVRDEHDHTINDVILAAVAGALRSWLLTRGESVPNGRELTALVPMSVTEDDGEPTSLGSQVAPHLQPLPIGEQNALMRLHQVAYSTQAHKDTGRAVDARTLSDIAGFAPTTLHALGVRVSNDVLPSTARRAGDERAGTADDPVRGGRAAGRELSGAAPGGGPPAGDRRDVVRRTRVLRADRRPRRGGGPRRARPVSGRRDGGAAATRPYARAPCGSRPGRPRRRRRRRRRPRRLRRRQLARKRGGGRVSGEPRCATWRTGRSSSATPGCRVPSGPRRRR